MAFKELQKYEHCLGKYEIAEPHSRIDIALFIKFEGAADTGMDG